MTTAAPLQIGNRVVLRSPFYIGIPVGRRGRILVVSRYLREGPILVRFDRADSSNDDSSNNPLFGSSDWSTTDVWVNLLDVEVLSALDLIAEAL